ncbi:MAG: TIM barrel protein [Streptosporangiales bacterium]|nr:TIM barrel protein [Streptosporangiales bacterium]
MMATAARVAVAPISWGVCEVPGWGHQLAPERVLGEMRALGVAATEFGPPGFLPADPARRSDVLRAHGMRAVGGFLAVVLHDAGRDPMPQVEAELDAFVTAGADTLVLAAATGRAGYDERDVLTGDQWRTLVGHLAAIAARAADRGVRATLHPHVGTMVEGPDEVARVLDASAVPLCLDTGHLLAGGSDPVALARDAASRIGHVHLKDVRADLVAHLRDGSLAYTDAVRKGLYAPLGTGDVDVAAIVVALEAAGYDGWYVLEQDCVLDAEPPAGAGPRDDVAASLAFLGGLLAEEP